jgi:hypothetical protein
MKKIEQGQNDTPIFFELRLNKETISRLNQSRHTVLTKTKNNDDPECYLNTGHCQSGLCK